MTEHKPGTYIRLKVSTQTIGKVVDTMGRAAEVAMTANGIATGVKLKRAAERRYRVENTLKTGRDIADIAGGLAGAISKLLQK